MQSKQELFERVRSHLLNQNWRSTDDNDNTLYYGPWGHKCAIGCLIPIEHYRHEIEGTGVCLTRIRSSMPSKPSGEHYLAHVLFKCGIDVDNEEILNLLIDLQDLHDVVPIERWNSELDAIAHQHGLALPL